MMGQVKMARPIVSLLLLLLGLIQVQSYSTSWSLAAPAVARRSLAPALTERSPWKIRQLQAADAWPLSKVVLAASTSSDVTLIKKTFAPLVLLNYIAAVTVQYSLITLAFLPLVQKYVLNQLPVSIPNLPQVKKALVWVLFCFLALRSRLFSPLDNSRPRASKDDPIFKNRIRPKWQPPVAVFPIVWSTITVLRATSAMTIFDHTQTLLTQPLFALILNLSIGDTWNTINNVEQRLGTSALVSPMVLMSASYAVYSMYKMVPLAGKILFPSLLWLCIANVLVWTVYRLNYKSSGQPSLLPSKEEGPPSPWRLPWTSP